MQHALIDFETYFLFFLQIKFALLAAIALQMMLSSQGENTKAFVQPRIKEITMELLKIIRETENDDLTTVMQKIVCSYTEQLIPVAEQMCLNLVETFAQVLEKE